jgi:hypothetical protein
LSQDICLFLLSAITHERWEGITALHHVPIKALTSASYVRRFLFCRLQAGEVKGRF